MALRFILGRAGTGKTRYCIEQFRAELRREPRLGPKLILLVPEQAALQTERSVLSGGIEGMIRGEVLSFRRLAKRILQSVPRPPRPVLSETGRIMVMQKLVEERTSELAYFRSARLLPGLHQQLANQIEEFIFCGISPESLAGMNEGDSASPTLRAKLGDLRQIYEAYLGFLQTGYVDPNQMLDEAVAHLPRMDWLKDARVWLDGFAHFTVQERKFLLALAAYVGRIEIAWLLDPGQDGILNDRPPSESSLFAPTERSYHSLYALARQAGQDIEPPHVLPDRRASDTSSSPVVPELQFLERNLFGGEDAFSEVPQQIEVYRAMDPRDEIEWMISRIHRLVSRSEVPLRYREIAIITRRFDDRAELLRSALQSHHIPYFMDRRVPLSEHPLYSLIRALLYVRLDDFSIESVRALLKSAFSGFSRDDADAMENYILTHSIEGSAAWTGPDWIRPPLRRSLFDEYDPDPFNMELLRQINAARGELIRRLSGWIDSPSVQTGRRWATDLFRALETLRVWEQIEEWAIRAEQDGETVEADRHRRAWTCWVEGLDDFVTALGDSSMDVGAFVHSLEAGLGQLDMGLVPAAVDQIVAGTIDRSRHSSVRAAFVLGFNEGEFPWTQPEPQMLNDEDRQILNQHGLDLDPPRSARWGEEQLLAYIALTRSSEQLFVSFCTASMEGKPLEPSPYLDDLRRVFPRLIVGAWSPGDVGETLRRVVSGRDLLAPLASHLGRSREADLARSDHRAVWNAVYDRARQRTDMPTSLRAALMGGIFDNRARLLPSVVSDVHQKPLRISVTALESFAACPFRYFCGSMLGLEERCTDEMDAVQLGSLYHHVLDTFTRRIMSQGRTLRDLSDSELSGELQACIDQFRHRLVSEAESNWLEQPFLWHRLFVELSIVLQMHRVIQSAGCTQTLASELWFGRPRSDSESSGKDSRFLESLPAISLDTPKGRRATLWGKIDRLDVGESLGVRWGFVFDYKRSRSRRLPLDEVYHGLSLQLMVYLWCLERAQNPELQTSNHDPRTVPQAGGAFYLPLIPDYTKVEHPDDAPESILKSFRPRGIVHDDAVGVLDSALRRDGAEKTERSSRILAAQFTQSGQINQSAGNDLIEFNQFLRLMEHVRHTVGGWCDGILDGEISVRPYRRGKKMPCSECPYLSVCRFEFPQDQVRRLESMKRKEIWESLIHAQ